MGEAKDQSKIAFSAIKQKTDRAVFSITSSYSDSDWDNHYDTGSPCA